MGQLWNIAKLNLESILPTTCSICPLPTHPHNEMSCYIAYNLKGKPHNVAWHTGLNSVSYGFYVCLLTSTKIQSHCDGCRTNNWAIFYWEGALTFKGGTGMSSGQDPIFPPLLPIFRHPVTASFNSLEPHFEQKSQILPSTREIFEKV